MAEKDVAKLQIAMDDLVVVHEGTRFHDLSHVVPHLWFCQSFAPLDQLHESLEHREGEIVLGHVFFFNLISMAIANTYPAFTQLQDQIYKVIVLETFQVVHNVLVVESLVDLDLCKQLKKGQFKQNG